MADFTPIRVSELPEVTNVGENDYLVVDDGIQTSKIKSKNYNERSSGSAKEYADEAARSASLSTERAEAAAQSVIQVDALAQSASASANNALNYSRDAEAWAKGTRGGSAVPITDATHENNAKYFAQQAQNSATSAAESADAAEELLVSAIDPTLTQAGKAADAKKTGDELASLSSAIEEVEPLSDDIKTALLNCFEHVAWIDDQGQDYYDALESALYPGPRLLRIEAVFNQPVETIYTDDNIESLRQYLTVTAYFNDSSTQVVTTYTLSGALVSGTSTITVTWQGVITTFTVTAVDFYNDIYTFSLANGLLHIETAGGGGRKYKSDGFGGCWAVFTNSPIIRRSAYVTHGKEVYYNNNTLAQYEGEYPIPIPDDATTITLTISPSSFYIGGGFIRYDSTLERYIALSGGITEAGSPVVASIPAGTNRFFTPNIKNSDNSTITVEPSTLSIAFSTQ